MTHQDLQPEPVLSPADALRLLADAGELLAGSLDYGRTLEQVAGMAVPELADWCGLLVLGDGETAEEQEITSGRLPAELDRVITDIRRARRGQEGASESRRVALSGEPILVTDVRGGGDADGLNAAQRALVARMAPKSYMVVPLTVRGRPLGSLTLLSTREGRHYTATDLGFAQALAARCALAIDNARVHREAQRSLGLLDAVFATAPVGLTFVDRELRVVHVNETMAAYDGRPVAEHLGRSLPEMRGSETDPVVDLCRRVLQTGQPLLDQELTAASAAHPGTTRYWTVSVTPVRDVLGEVLGVSAVVIDSTERRALLDSERDARWRADFLAEAGVLLDESLDYEATLRAVAEIAVPRVADWCAVSLLGADGVLQQVAAAHVDPAQRALGEELSRRFPPRPDALTGTVAVARSGATEFVPHVTDEMLVAGLPDPEQLKLVRRLGLRSVIIAPLRARGRTLGTLTLASAESGRRFDERDVQLAEDLARRAGLSIDNARLSTERAHIAHTLQAKLLPERLSHIPGAQTAARYRAAGELNEVGGDFYDVFPCSASEWAMVVGDVSGKGAEAAAITALARYTLRAAAIDSPAPSHALSRLNEAMLEHDDSGLFITAVAVYLSAREDGGMSARVALAGHPPAMVIRAGGLVERVGTFGPLLGMVPHAAWHDQALRLDPGDVLLLYTDGITEAGSRSTPFGERGLMTTLARVPGRSPQEVVDAVEQAVLDAQPGAPRDDLALLALGIAERPCQRRSGPKDTP